ncbi:MAG TPA: TonB-dependent receptor, partial [Pyrinomonadaceae bacterium]|nr:TonB-dependent receptor [Pyrinomonadaceae bacterium]
GAVFAQETTGNLNGTVKDSSGAAVKGATVTITNEEKKGDVRTVTTNDEGQYSAPNLPVATYTVAVEAPNFKKAVQTGVKLDVNQRRSVDVDLEAGNIAEVVTVEADPVAVELTTPQASTVINGTQVRELSINNRNFLQLVTLAPGVSNDLSDQVYVGTVNPDGQTNTVNISVNGGRSSQNTYLVDGADVTDRGSNITIQAYPSVDSIEEFSVLRSLYPAESGRSGGGQVNIVTRSGGDKFHGSMFEFLRNERLNANDFLTNQTIPPPFGLDSNGKAKRKPFRYNNYGFTVGGPIYFFNFGEGNNGGIFRKLKNTFFFFSEEQRRDLRYPTLPLSSVPDANMRQGIFPIDICLSANAPTTATATCLNVLPRGTPLSSVATINPVAQSYLTNIYSKLPLPTDAVTRGLTATAINKANFRQEIVKIDHHFTNNVSAFYRFENDKIPTLDANGTFAPRSDLPGVSTTETNSPGKTHTFQLTDTLNSKMIVEGRYSYGYGAILSNSVGLIAKSVSPIAVSLPFPSVRDMVPIVTGNGFNALQGFGDYNNFSWKQNFNGSFTLINGNHTMKFGTTYSLYRKNENALAGVNQGQFSGFLNTLTTSVQQLSVLAPNAATQETNAARRANFQSFANFLLGNNATFTQAHFDYTADFRQNALESYAQDEWRFRPNLTLYYGLRYSRYGQPFDKNGRLSNFDPFLFDRAQAPQVTGAGNRVIGTGNLCNGIIVNKRNYQTAPNCTPTVSPYGDKIISTSNKDFAPRVGLAWDPFSKGKTSIRTGYGIYHEQVLAGYAEQILGINPPYQDTITISNTRLDNLGGGSASAPSPTLRGIDPNWHTPYMQHWSLDWQQQLGNNTVFTLGYYGSKGTHLIGIVEINELPPGLAINSRCATGANFLGQSPAPATVQCQVPGTGFFSSAATNILDQLRPYRGYRSITMLEPRFNSNYHSLQISAQHRFAGSSQVNLAYTWSKNLTDEQNDRTNAPENSYDIGSEYSRAALDRRHVLSVNYVYELPFFAGEKGLAGKLLGGWQSSGILVYNTGLPFTVTTSAFDASGLGNISALVAGNRPNVTCDPNANAPHTLQKYFNTQCFQANPAVNSTTISNTPGNSPRGIINGPSTKRVDFSLMKNIRFSESVRLQLRGEAFNIFNWTSFRSFSTTTLNVTQNTFGAITAVRDPRTIQLGVKFYF